MTYTLALKKIFMKQLRYLVQLLLHSVFLENIKIDQITQIKTHNHQLLPDFKVNLSLHHCYLV